MQRFSFDLGLASREDAMKQVETKHRHRISVALRSRLLSCIKVNTSLNTYFMRSLGWPVNSLYKSRKLQTLPPTLLQEIICISLILNKGRSHWIFVLVFSKCICGAGGFTSWSLLAFILHLKFLSSQLKITTRCFGSCLLG